MKKVIAKIVPILENVYGYGIMLCLFAGGMTFFGYIIAIILGGELATTICEVIYKTIFPYIIYCSTVLVLIGLVIMYLNGEKALMAGKKKIVKKEGER